MRYKLRKWFRPPRFPGDEERTRRAAVLNSLGNYYALGLLAAAVVLVPFFTVRILENSAILAVLALLLFLGRAQLRRGGLERAAAVVLVPSWVVFFAMAILSGGITSPIMSAVVAATVVGAIVFREAAARAFLLAAIGGGLVLALLPHLGVRLPPHFHIQPLSAWCVVSLSVFFMARLATLYSRGLARLADERRVLGLARDRVQHALGESEARFRAVVEHSHDGILFLDRTLTIVYRSPSYRQVNGYEDEERIGFGGLTLVHPDDQELVRRSLEDLASRPGGFFRLEYRIRHKDGRWLWVDSYAQNFLDDPDIRAIVFTTRDITERKAAEEGRRESEAVFRALFNEANDSVLLLEQPPGGGLVIADANASACQAHGYTREELLGRSIADLTAPSTRPLVAGRIARLAAEGRASFDSVHQRKDGTEFDMAVSVRRVDRRGKPPLIFSIERDITARTHAEAELRQSEERYRMLVDLSPDAVMVHRGGRILFVNAAAAAIFGASSERELVGTEVSRLVHPDFQADVTERSRRVQGEGLAAPRKEQKCVRLDGSVFDIEASSAPVPWRGVRSSLTVLRDISPQRRSERLQARYALLNENVRDPILLLTLDGRIAEANPAAAAFYGCSEGELAGLGIFDLRPADPPGAILAQLEQARREGIFFETTHVCRDATAVPVEVYSRKVSVDGEDMLLSVIRDIRVRRAAENRLRDSEEKWRSIINASPDAILVASLDGTIQQASRKVFELWGYDADRDVIGHCMFDLLVPEDRGRARDTFASILSGRTAAPAQYVGLRRDGRRRTIEVNREVLRDAQGHPTGVVIVLRDVTDRVALEAQLRQAQKMESVGRLAGGVAHDFNNLLQVILGNAREAVESLPAGAPQRGHLQEILDAGERSAELTRQLLAFARRQDVMPQVVDLNESVSRALKMLQRLIGEDIELVWKPGPGLWNVKIDPAQVDQVLANLASNARDAIRGVGTLTVRTSNQVLDEAWCAARQGAEPGEYVRLSVGDTGQGMSAEVLSHLFEPFFTTKVVGQGTGLGLATVYGIVKQGRGFIDVQSEPAVGTVFNVYLPRTADSPAGDGRRPEEHTTGGSETVLVVEDEPGILLLMRRTLERLGYSVLAAHSPLEALRAVREHVGPLDLLLSDVVMPGMDGKQLYECVKAARPGVRALFMSGYTAEVISQRGVIESGTPFIQKPFSKAALAAAVREILHRGP